MHPRPASSCSGDAARHSHRRRPGRTEPPRTSDRFLHGSPEKPPPGTPAECTGVHATDEGSPCIVVEEDEIPAPADAHRQAGAEHDGNGGLEPLGPPGRRSERRLRPVAGTNASSHLTATRGGRRLVRFRFSVTFRAHGNVRLASRRFRISPGIRFQRSAGRDSRVDNGSMRAAKVAYMITIEQSIEPARRTGRTDSEHPAQPGRRSLPKRLPMTTARAEQKKAGISS